MLGYQFGGKAYGHPRLMKQRKLKSQYWKDENGKRKLFLCVVCWNIEKEKDGEKQKVGRQAGEAQRGKELEQERKSKGNIFLLQEQHEFCSGGEKMRNACFHRGKNERREKKKKNSQQVHVQHFLHITGNQEVSRCSRAQQQQQKIGQKRVLQVQIVSLQIRPIAVIVALFEQNVNSIESFAFSPG